MALSAPGPTRLIRDHARGPRSSQRAVASIVTDKPLKELIMDAVRYREHFPIGECNDTWLWEWLEDTTQRRFQRNVLARARGRLVKEGLLVGVGEMEYKGVFIEHYERVGRFAQAVQQRLDKAWKQVQDADPAVRQAFRDEYNAQQPLFTEDT